MNFRFKQFIFSFLAVGLFSVSAFANSHCSDGLDRNTDPALKQFIDNFNPFWGTWRGSYENEAIVGEIYLDKSNKFNVRGTWKTHDVKDQKVRLCYKNKKFQAVVYGFYINLTVVNSRRMQANHFLIKNGPIVAQR